MQLEVSGGKELQGVIKIRVRWRVAITGREREDMWGDRGHRQQEEREGGGTGEPL